MFNIMLKIRDTSLIANIVPFTSVCATCLKHATDGVLMRCSGCKLISYCCKEHQTSRWHEHKEFCKVVQKLLKNKCLPSLFDDKAGDFRSPAAWSKYRNGLAKHCKSVLKRELSFLEENLLMKPHCCQICHKYKVNSMITCTKCHVTSYCSVEHKVIDDSFHKTVCNELKLYLDLSLINRNGISLSADILGTNKLPSDMKSYTQSFVKCIKTLPRTNETVTKTIISDCLSIPLTIAYALEKGGASKKGNINKLVVHIMDFRIAVVRVFRFWESLFHLYKKLDFIQVVFIGPDCNSITVQVFQSFIDFDMCLNCTKKAKKIECYFVNKYNNYLESMKYDESPDIIIGYNCEINRTLKSVHFLDNLWWYTSIPLLLSYPKTLLVFTHWTKDKAVDQIKEFRLINKSTDIEYVVQCKENPFRSLSPTDDDFFKEGKYFSYSNNYISIIRT